MVSIQLGLQIDILVYSFILCVLMCVYLRKNNYKDSYSLKLFMNIVLATTFVVVIEIFSIVATSGTNNISRFILYWSSALFLSLAALPAALWLVYLDYKILRRKGSYKLRTFLYFVPTLLFTFNNFVVNTNFKPGFVFSIVSLNQYIRGPALWLHVVIMYSVIILALFNFYRSSNMIKGRVTQVVLVAVILPFVGNLIQMMFYGLVVSLPTYVLATFIVYLILEKDELLRDELTKLYTRSYLENRVFHKLSVKDKFSLIMLDLNDFKMINDEQGHSVGDQVLIDVAQMLEENVGIEDTVCRLGGDEFVVIIEERGDVSEEKIEQFDKRLKEINKDLTDFKISLSYGYVYIDYSIDYAIYELMELVDKKMYKDKQRRKALN